MTESLLGMSFLDAARQLQGRARQADADREAAGGVAAGARPLQEMVLRPRAGRRSPKGDEGQPHHAGVVAAVRSRHLFRTYGPGRLALIRRCAPPSPAGGRRGFTTRVDGGRGGLRAASSARARLRPPAAAASGASGPNRSVRVRGRSRRPIGAPAARASLAAGALTRSAATRASDIRQREAGVRALARVEAVERAGGEQVAGRVIERLHRQRDAGDRRRSGACRLPRCRSSSAPGCRSRADAPTARSSRRRRARRRRARAGSPAGARIEVQRVERVRAIAVHKDVGARQQRHETLAIRRASADRAGRSVCRASRRAAPPVRPRAADRCAARRRRTRPESASRPARRARGSDRARARRPADAPASMAGSAARLASPSSRRINGSAATAAPCAERAQSLCAAHGCGAAAARHHLRSRVHLPTSRRRRRRPPRVRPARRARPRRRRDGGARWCAAG